MSRRFTILALLSLLLCVSFIAVRAATYHTRKKAVVGGSSDDVYGIGSLGGYICVGHLRFSGPPLDSRQRGWAEDVYLTYRTDSKNGNGDILSALGFDYYNESIIRTNVFYSSGLKSIRVLAVSYTTLIFLAAVLPAVWVYQARRRVVLRTHRQRNGQCVECGYDLIGNSSGTCPECGKPLTAAPPDVS